MLFVWIKSQRLLKCSRGGLKRTWLHQWNFLLLHVRFMKGRMQWKLNSTWFHGLLQISVRSEISLLIGELSNSPQFVTASSFHLSSSLIFIPALISIPHFLPHHSDYVDQPTLRLSNWYLKTKSVRKFQKSSWYSLIYWVILSSLKG